MDLDKFIYNLTMQHPCSIVVDIGITPRPSRKENMLTKSDMQLMLPRLQNRQGRSCDANTVAQQIGRMTVLGITGGKRLGTIHNDQNEPIGVLLLCGSNRAVEVILDFSDTYTVQRIRRITGGAKKGEIIVEEATSDVYCDELNNAVWKTSCWK